MALTAGGMEIPETHYARSGDVSIAYQVYGTGEVPVVAVPPAASAVEMIWDWVPAHHYFERWGAFARVAHFDKRGTGHSDRLAAPAPLDERMDDIRVVMDAAGMDDAVVFGLSEGGPLSMLFAATYPERTRALVLQATTPAFDFVDRSLSEEFIAAWADGWGTEASITPSVFCPSHAGDPEFLRFNRRYERASVTPGALRSVMTMNLDIDVTHVLSAIACPTLVVHAAGDQLMPIEQGRLLGDTIPGAKFFSYESNDHWSLLDAVDEQMDAIEQFLTGSLRSTPTDRVLATVLFTDIVSSTERAASLGDGAWRVLLDQHDAVVKQPLAQYRGQLVNTTGDGLLATFDSPARAIRCAGEMVRAARGVGVDIRAGVHTGEVERRGDDIAGLNVHIGARVAGAAGAGEVLVSAAVPPLVAGSGLEFTDRGEYELKGVPGAWRLYAVA